MVSEEGEVDEPNRNAALHRPEGDPVGYKDEKFRYEDDPALLTYDQLRFGPQAHQARNPYIPLSMVTGMAFQKAKYAHLGMHAENRQRRDSLEHRYSQSLVCTHGE